MTKINCECGLSYNPSKQIYHERTTTHQYYLDHGEPKKLKIDTNYPVGCKKRYYPAVYEAVKRYYNKKRLLKLQTRLASLSVSMGDTIIEDC